jgi:hypothetical protein
LTAATFQTEALAAVDPAAHYDQVKRGCIEDSPEQAPSVIALNMRAASAAVMEFIARVFPLRFRQIRVLGYQTAVFPLRINRFNQAIPHYGDHPTNFIPFSHN